MDMRGYIEVTEIDTRLIVQVAYSGSRPQGLGFLHAKSGGLSESELDEIMQRAERERIPGNVHLDYLNGRSMKFHVRVNEDGKKYVDLDWYDHGRESTKHLVRECGVPDVEARIAAAEAGKAEKAREWDERQTKSAHALLKIVQDLGGRVRSNEPPFAEYYKLEEGHPVAEAWMYGRTFAVEKGWLTASEDWRTYTLTAMGRELAA